MKKNKKGFTLVELLAVIVILGVLLMIAVPAIQNVINKSRRNSFESAVKLTIENVETLSSTAKVEGAITPCYVVFGDADFLNGETSEINLERGSYGKGTFGIIVVDSDGKGKAYVNGNGGTYYVTGETLATLKTSTPTNATQYESLTNLKSNFAKSGSESLSKCSAQSWWES